MEDRLTFENLEDVFNFVAEFGCFNHEELIKTQNINMIRFMNDVSSFKGEISDGTTNGKCFIKFKNGNEFQGLLKNFQKTGYGEMTKGSIKVMGTFSNDELTYGIIDYGNGALFEGKLLDYERNGRGIMVFQDKNYFSGIFIGDLIHQEGGTLNFNGKDYEVFYVHIHEFDIGIFVVKENKQLFVLDCKSRRVYDSKLIDTLKESGIDIR